MKKSRIYTKTGDQGETGLVSGNRTRKSDLRIDLYGELDELNSRMGLCSSQLAVDHLEYQQIVNFLHHIQSAIFDLGSNLACELENRQKFNLPQISDAFIKDIEEEIDRLDSELSPLKNFILPGGSVIAATIHMARTNARTVERKIVKFHESTKEELPLNALIFLNRLSDYLFVLARYVNKVKGVEEIAWKPRN
ncbi:MAG: cob(I)yrinic acid a,c-diamide adenosyltransferase [Bacteriovoracaceae bacterium]|nr:cob(I)yrinic acid a,c-diamide adenosyltransferase [Bacteriovoracaceae bacterium]